MSSDKPEVGQKFVHARDGDVTVTGVFKRGKPPKDGGFGGYVTYALYDGEERRAKYRDWVKAVRIGSRYFPSNSEFAIAKKPKVAKGKKGKAS